MAGSTASTTEDTERLFDARLGPSPRPGEWTLRVRQLEPWTIAQRDAWVDHVRDGFVHLAVAGGLAGERGDPLATAFRGDVEMWEVDDWVEWRFGEITVDPGSATLLFNLCDWATFHVAPAVEVEILTDALPPGPEPQDRPLPQRLPNPGFAVEERGQPTDELSIEIELGRLLNGADVAQLTHFLKPWHTALLRWGFALPTLPTGMSEVRLATPPLIVVDDLWCHDFDRFAARYEAVDALVNCLAWMHRTVYPVKRLVIS